VCKKEIIVIPPVRGDNGWRLLCPLEYYVLKVVMPPGILHTQDCYASGILHNQGCYAPEDAA